MVMKNYQQKQLDESGKRSFDTPPVTKYMTRKLVTFHPDTEIHKVIEQLLEHRISGAPVLDDKGRICGVIDDKDCLNTLIDSLYYNQPVGRNKVSDYMTDVYKCINSSAKIGDVANLFIRSNFKRLLVVDDNDKLVGSISRRDVLKAIRDM